MKAIGLVEIRGLVAAVEALDQMEKAANVNFLTWEKRLGGRLVTIVVQGEVSSVQEAVDRAVNTALSQIAASAVIPNPHPEIMKQIEISAKKYKKQE